MPALAAFSTIPADAVVNPSGPSPKVKLGQGQLSSLSSYYHDVMSKSAVESRALTELDTAGHDVTADSEDDGLPRLTGDDDSDDEDMEKKALEDMVSKMEGEEKAAATAALKAAKAKQEEKAKIRANRRAKSGTEFYDPTAFRICGYQTTWSKDIFSFLYYVLFLASFCVAILGRGASNRFDYYNALETHLASGEYKSSSLRLVTFQDMKTKGDWFDYMDTLLVPTLFPSDRPYTRSMSAGLGLLLGSARVRQARVEAESCTVAKRFRESVTRCDAKLSAADEDIESTFNGVKWRTAQELNSGFHELYSFESKKYYDNGGYVVSLDYETARDVMASLRSGSWLDTETRLVSVEFVTYSPASGLLATVRLAAEFMPSGDVLPLLDLSTHDEWHYWRTYEGEVKDAGIYAAGVFEVILYALNAIYSLQELAEVVSQGTLYFKSNHNIIELFGCAALNTALAYRVLSFKALLLAIPGFADEAFPELGSFTYYSEIAISLQCIVSLVVFAKFFKLFKFHKTLNIFFETMSTALNKVMAFIFVMFVFFLAYALSFHIAFGHVNHSFMDFPESLFSLFMTVLGSFNIRDLVQANSAARILGPFLFSSFIVINMFLLLSMMFAMIKLSYDDVIEKHFADYVNLPKKHGKRKREPIPPLARDLVRIALSWLRLLSRIKCCGRFILLTEEANTSREKALARIIMGSAGIEEVMRKRAIELDKMQDMETGQGKSGRHPSFRSSFRNSRSKLELYQDAADKKEGGEKDKAQKSGVLVLNPKLDLLKQIVEVETTQKAQLASIDFLSRMVRAKAFAVVDQGVGGGGGKGEDVNRLKKIDT